MTQESGKIGPIEHGGSAGELGYVYHVTVQLDPRSTREIPPLTAQPGACTFAVELQTAGAVDEAFERLTFAGHEAVSTPTRAEIGALGRIGGIAIRDPYGFLTELYAPERRAA